MNKILLVTGGLILTYVCGWLVMTGAVWVLFRIAEKIMGTSITWSVWWSGLFVYLVWLLLKK